MLMCNFKKMLFVGDPSVILGYHLGIFVMFIAFYLRDASHRSMDTFTIGVVVAA